LCYQYLFWKFFFLAIVNICHDITQGVLTKVIILLEDNGAMIFGNLKGADTQQKDKEEQQT
jgi:hypothetical protein